MTLRLPSRLTLAIVAASILVFITGGHFAANALLDAQRFKQLRELSEVALRRAESAADYGAATLDELARLRPISCDSAALQAVRLLVYQRAAVKDIRVIERDGRVLCSAYSETLEFDKGWVGRSDMLPARDSTVRIFRVDQFFGVALGVSKDVDDKISLVAVLGINDSLFDIMPSELRDHGTVTLELGDGQIISPAAKPARLIRTPTSLRLAAMPAEDVVNIQATSQHYPLRAIIRVEKSALAGWDSEPYFPIVLLAAALGLVFGILLGRAIARQKGPLAEIDDALAAREFKPYLQPIFNLRTGEIVGCEVLARWIRADGTVVPPSRFIQLVEDHGRIEQLTWQILSGALNELRAQLSADKYFKVSVNIVPHHMVAPDFVDELKQIVASARVSPRQVVLEITEREDLPDLARAAAVIAELRDFGFGVAIDDVGIGHSGLSHIQKLGANILKVDKFFVDTICSDSSATAVVEMLVRLARQLRMRVVAEGIEDNMQLAALIECGIEEGQGYVVSPPMPVNEFFEFLDRQKAQRSADQPIAEVA